MIKKLLLCKKIFFLSTIINANRVLFNKIDQKKILTLEKY